MITSVTFLVAVIAGVQCTRPFLSGNSGYSNYGRPTGVISRPVIGTGMTQGVIASNPSIVRPIVGTGMTQGVITQGVMPGYSPNYGMGAQPIIGTGVVGGYPTQTTYVPTNTVVGSRPVMMGSGVMGQGVVGGYPAQAYVPTGVVYSPVRSGQQKDSPGKSKQ